MSLTACLAAKVPKVTIRATLFRPYLCIQYSITSSLLVSSKSTSISGIVILSGFKNRSKSKLYFKGSIVVIFRQYATKEPAALPLPGPTKMPWVLAKLM